MHVAVIAAEDMGDTTSNSVLGRIAAAGSDERKARAMTLHKALRLTVAKAADALMDLPVAMIGAVTEQIKGDGIEDKLDDAQLLMILDGPVGQTGAVMIAPTLVGAMIQQQTIGSVHPDTGGDRAMTRTDAAICAPLVDAMFERTVPILDDPADAALIEGFRFGVKAEDARTLAMRLDADTYTVLRLTLDVARGARQGEMVLILPVVSPKAAPDALDENGEDTGQGTSLTNAVMTLNADLDMVLFQLHLPLNAIQALARGDELPVPAGAFPNVQITTLAGRVVGRGIVGHVEGVRAVKPQRKPTHATQPMRRASDEPMVDMPRVEDIAGPGRRESEERHMIPADDDMDLDMALPQEEVTDTAADAADGPAVEPDAGLPQLDALPDLSDLPDLADLPDLNDLPDLAAQSGS